MSHGTNRSLFLAVSHEQHYSDKKATAEISRLQYTCNRKKRDTVHVLFKAFTKQVRIMRPSFMRHNIKQYLQAILQWQYNNVNVAH